jgi:hypothetical protein
MATIQRHPVPPESYEPDRPLNDLGRDQFALFTHVAERLPAEVRATQPPVPSPEDGMAASRFIAAITQYFLAQKQPPLLKQPKLAIVPRQKAGKKNAAKRPAAKPSRKAPASGLSLAASARRKSPASPRGKRPASKSKRAGSGK